MIAYISFSPPTCSYKSVIIAIRRWGNGKIERWVLYRASKLPQIATGSVFSGLSGPKGYWIPYSMGEESKFLSLPDISQLLEILCTGILLTCVCWANPSLFTVRICFYGSLHLGKKEDLGISMSLFGCGAGFPLEPATKGSEDITALPCPLSCTPTEPQSPNRDPQLASNSSWLPKKRGQLNAYQYSEEPKSWLYPLEPVKTWQLLNLFVLPPVFSHL